MKNIILLTIIVISSLFSQVNYNSQIQPIFNTNCTSCHYSSGGMGFLNLTSFSNLNDGGVSGPSIISGDSQNSLLYQRVTQPTGTDGSMPPNVPLSQSEIDLIAQWIDEGATTLSVEKTNLPRKYALHQNYPNPFNPNTTLSFILSEASLVTIRVYDMKGKVVKTLVNGQRKVGYNTTSWNAKNERNNPVSAGVYLYTIEAGEFRQTNKMILLK